MALDEYCATGGTPEQLIGRFAAELALIDTGVALSAGELLDGLNKADLFGCGNAV